jgi:excisionase family DNA binding protein
MSPAQESLGLVEDGLLTVAEAQEYSRLSRSDLYARMERGQLAYVKLGRRRLIPRRALVEMAAQGLVLRSAIA